jgi:hypothetical protein
MLTGDCKSVTVFQSSTTYSLYYVTDGRNVAFGVVVSGQETVDTISKQFHVDGKPLQDVIIKDCGLLA